MEQWWHWRRWSGGGVSRGSAAAVAVEQWSGRAAGERTAVSEPCSVCPHTNTAGGDHACPPAAQLAPSGQISPFFWAGGAAVGRRQTALFAPLGRHPAPSFDPLMRRLSRCEARYHPRQLGPADVSVYRAVSARAPSAGRFPGERRRAAGTPLEERDPAGGRATGVGRPGWARP